MALVRLALTKFHSSTRRRCAGSSVRAYCSVPLALATMANANPKLCTMYCPPGQAAA